jgi:hypothetical protein
MSQRKSKAVEQNGPTGSRSPAGRILRIVASCVALVMVIPFVPSSEFLGRGAE